MGLRKKFQFIVKRILQKKYKEALKMIESELGQKILSYFIFSRKRIKLLTSLETWNELNIYSKKILLEE